MKKVFILYDKVTGTVTGVAKIDQERDETCRDGSTALEYIERKLIEDPALDVAYFPLGTLLPDPALKKISGGKIVDKSKQEIDEAVQKQKWKELISDKMREMAEEALIAEGKISPE